MPDKKTRTKGQPNRPGKVTSRRGQSSAPKQGGKPRPQKTKTAAGISADSKVIDKDTKIKMLHYMQLTRAIEDRIERKLYRQGRIVGGVYVGLGQEAISIGTAIHMVEDDVVTPSHRDM